ncbi:signal peptidase I [Pantoea sp. Aalb]|uniref:signal peptidase I n=1 Tax=Pantoea sp. Aalb TaxID=2576762 RepID=UPI001320873E|nr:signal peptidase I [Pantoea sp. Aalb]MXP67243.1 signal peptidase I [Pantoea sp. Aalb]
MANIFALILITSTLITGIIWCFLKWFSESYQKKSVTNVNKILNIKTVKYWLETIASLFPVLAIVLIIRSFIFEPFQIPSASMMPTLLIGDFIIVEKFAYGIKDPITQTTIIPTWYPQRGDVAVFKYPKDPSINYIKRIIGLPGDKIIFNPLSKTLTVSFTQQKKNSIVKLPIIYTDIQPSSFIQTFNFFGEKVINGFYQVLQGKNMYSGLRLDTRKEKIGNVSYDILLLNQVQSQVNMYYQQPGQPKSTWIVPQGQYFVMGDNRDNSADSRYWGFVPEKNLVGKAVAIWMSFEKQEGQWPTNIRLNRIGRIK